MNISVSSGDADRLVGYNGVAGVIGRRGPIIKRIYSINLKSEKIGEKTDVKGNGPLLIISHGNKSFNLPGALTAV